jgi:hypothetical protein
MSLHYHLLLAQACSPLHSQHRSQMFRVLDDHLQPAPLVPGPANPIAFINQRQHFSIFEGTRELPDLYGRAG